MKKFLKGFGIFFFSFGFIVYTIMFFTEAPELRPVFIMMDVIMGFFLFLLLRKRKPKQKAPPKTEPTVQVHSNLNPERAIKSMPGAYTVAEAKNHVRIVQDCLNIFEKNEEP